MSAQARHHSRSLHPHAETGCAFADRPPRNFLGGAIVFAVARDLSTLVLVTELINE